MTTVWRSRSGLGAASGDCTDTNSNVSRRLGLRRALHAAFVISFALAVCSTSYSQSTFGTVLGTVKDPSGSVIAQAKVSLINTGTNAVRSTLTNSDGSYQFVNTEIGNYKLTVESRGFQLTEHAPFDLAARVTLRLDMDLQIASQTTRVEVEAVPRARVVWN
jgi:hypothetical protein